MDFTGYDRVEPTFDDAPDSYGLRRANRSKLISGEMYMENRKMLLGIVHTLKDPGRLMYKDDPQTFGIVGLETLDHELDWYIVLPVSG